MIQFSSKRTAAAGTARTSRNDDRCARNKIALKAEWPGNGKCISQTNGRAFNFSSHPLTHPPSRPDTSPRRSEPTKPVGLRWRRLFNASHRFHLLANGFHFFEVVFSVEHSATELHLDGLGNGRWVFRSARTVGLGSLKLI